MRRLIMLFCGSVLAWTHVASAAPVFRLDGQPVEPATTRVLGDGTSAGDVLRIGEHTLVLREAAQYDFETDQDGHTLWLKEGRERRRVAVKILPEHNPLAALSAAEAAGLWGVCVGHWSEAIGQSLTKIDPRRTFVRFLAGVPVGKTKALPELARDLAYVATANLSSEVEIGNFTALRGATNLLYLDLALVVANTQNLEPAWIAGCKDLRYLSAHLDRNGQDWPKGSFPRLHTLDVGGRPLDFLAQVPSVEVLHAPHRGDLGQIVVLPNLRELQARNAVVSNLPAVHLPSLRLAQLVGSTLSETEVQAFRRLNPQARVFYRYKDELLAVTVRADRIRVRSGGTCHREPAEERLLAEVTAAAEIKALLDAIELVEPRRGSMSRCKCCGNPSVEFYEGDKLVTTLGYHHAQSLRWGHWRSDPKLTRASAGAVAQWMARHGVAGPAQWHQANEQVAEAIAEVRRVQLTLLPAELAQSLSSGLDRYDQYQLVLKALPDPVQRAQVSLRLLGVSPHGFGLYDELAWLAYQDILRLVSAKDLLAALRALPANDEVAWRGAARWLLAEGKIEGFAAADLDGLIPAIAPKALTQPDFEDRRNCLLTLAKLKTPNAVQALRAALRGQYTPRQRPKASFGGASSGIRGGPRVEGESDPVVAAQLLAQAGDSTSREAIVQLHQTLSGKDRDLVGVALQQLK